jgi:hypothetical protein
MTIEINLAFYEEAHLDDKRMDLYSERRKPPQRFAMVLITSCEHKDWWYSSFIGTECFVLLRFQNYGYGEFVREAVCVRLTNTRYVIGRSISAKDFIII